MKKQLKNNKGVTLIALIVIIVILAIAVTVALKMLLEEKESSTNSEQHKSEIVEAKNSGKEFTEIKTEVTDSKGNKVVIPGGFKIAEDSGDTVQQGIVIEDVSASKDKNVEGSQFVWIPVGIFVKDDGSTSNEIVLGRYTFDETDGTPILVQEAYTEENPENYKSKVEVNFNGYKYKELPDYQKGVASSEIGGLNATAND